VTLADVERLLAELDPALSCLSEPWCVIGSAAMMIAGAPVADCPDLDIMTTAAGAATLETRWAGWRDETYTPTSGEVFRSRFSGYAFRDGRVEVMGDLLLIQAGRWTPVAIPPVVATTLAGHTVNIPDRQAQIDLFRLFGRPKDLAKAALLAG